MSYDKTKTGAGGRKTEMLCTAVTTRLPDDTVKTPAGVFTDCVHLAVKKTTAVEGIKTQAVVRCNLWLSPTGVLVKEERCYQAICAPDGRIVKPERRSYSILRSSE